MMGQLANLTDAQKLIMEQARVLLKKVIKLEQRHY